MGSTIIDIIIKMDEYNRKANQHEINKHHIFFWIICTYIKKTFLTKYPNIGEKDKRGKFVLLVEETVGTFSTMKFIDWF